jgi:hypothetical protein
MLIRALSFCVVIVCVIVSFAGVVAQDQAQTATTQAGPLPGHSHHGEVFDQGPRQKAYLMPGMPKIHFPVTTKSPEAQKFFEQGMGQIHGFWYYEAER